MDQSTLQQPSLKTPKKVTNGEVHGWYRIALGYSDTLVSYILDRFQVQIGQVVFDPFCGSGTTLVECKKRGIMSVGIDANPSSVFASIVKTKWNINPSDLTNFLSQIEILYNNIINTTWDYHLDPTYQYLDQHGMIERGWISPLPLQKCLSIKKAIRDLGIDNQIADLLMLALIGEVVYGASNVKFGPQLYCGKAKTDVDVITEFKVRVQKIAADLEIVRTKQQTTSNVILGDARYMNELACSFQGIQFDYVICSPPYPGEHDYTRHSRLELAFLEEVSDRASLQKIKKNMIRSNTKGIYKTDSDKELISGNPEIAAIVQELEEKIKGKTHGFARLYPVVVQEYFGGMKRHLTNLFPLLTNKARCGYVLGDQFSYLQVPISTAKLLSTIAEESGFIVDGIEYWKTSWSTKTSKKLDENILIFHKP